MASAVLAGVDPVYGHYNLIAGTPVGAHTTSSVYMAVINTSVMALVVNTALTRYSGKKLIRAMVPLTLLGVYFSSGWDF
jgi:MFS superfamily sulfate permease-like transporter